MKENEKGVGETSLLITIQYLGQKSSVPFEKHVQRYAKRPKEANNETLFYVLQQRFMPKHKSNFMSLRLIRERINP